MLPACGIGPWRSASWSFCPLPSGALAAEQERSLALRNEANTLARELARKRLACASLAKPPPPPLELPRQAGAPRAQQTALLKPPPPPPSPPKAADLPADRWARKDLGLLQGCWRVGEPTPIFVGGERCTATAGTLCFDSNGNGTDEQQLECPRSGTFFCRAPVKAQFNNEGALVGDQADGPCRPRNRWVKRTLTCQRVDDTKATCLDQDFSGRKYVPFRRSN